MLTVAGFLNNGELQNLSATWPMCILSPDQWLVFTLGRQVLFGSVMLASQRLQVPREIWIPCCGEGTGCVGYTRGCEHSPVS